MPGGLPIAADDGAGRCAAVEATLADYAHRAATAYLKTPPTRAFSAVL